MNIFVNTFAFLNLLFLFSCSSDPLQEALKNPDMTTSLNLSGKGLTAIPVEVYQLKNLQELNLNNNQLKDLPEDLSKLKNLQILKVGWNQFTEFPKVLYQLPELKLLEIPCNELTQIPIETAKITKLKEFVLYGNKLPDDEWILLDSILPNTSVSYYAVIGNISGFYFNKAVYYHQKGNAQNALKWYNAAINEDPNYANSYLNKGLILVQSGDKNGGCNDFQIAKQKGAKEADQFIATYCR